MNKAFLSGRLTAKPDIRKTNDGNHYIAGFTIAVDRFAKDEADFIRVKAWDKKAEFAEKYLDKGSKIIVIGRIQTGSYKDKDDKTVYTTDIIADEIEFAESKKAAAQQNDNSFMNIPEGVEEDLPFN